jgi:hypothetical protein
MTDWFINYVPGTMFIGYFKSSRKHWRAWQAEQLLRDPILSVCEQKKGFPKTALVL